MHLQSSWIGTIEQKNKRYVPKYLSNNNKMTAGTNNVQILSLTMSFNCVEIFLLLLSYAVKVYYY